MFHKQLKNHKGGLIRIKTQLWWYGIGWDNMPGRVCLLLDAPRNTSDFAVVATTTHTSAFGGSTQIVLLLIDGSPKWIMITERDMEFINDTA